MNPDFLEAQPFQKSAAGRILREHPAGELVHPSCRRCFDQCGKGRAAGAAAAVIPPHIDRELADAAVTGAAAVGKRRRESDSARFTGFGGHHEMLSSEPPGDVSSRTRLGFERGNAVGDALVINFRNRGGIGDLCRPRFQWSYCYRCSGRTHRGQIVHLNPPAKHRSRGVSAAARNLSTTELRTEKRQHIHIQLLVECAAVEARRIRADLWTGRGQWGRARGEKGKMSRVRDHMIFVFYRKTAIHCGDHVRRYAVTAKLRRPELDRHFDA